MPGSRRRGSKAQKWARCSGYPVTEGPAGACARGDPEDAGERGPAGLCSHVAPFTAGSRGNGVVTGGPATEPMLTAVCQEPGGGSYRSDCVARREWQPGFCPAEFCRQFSGARSPGAGQIDG